MLPGSSSTSLMVPVKTHHFSAESPLSELYTVVKNLTDNKYGSFSLSTTFPNRNLDNQEKETSLKYLQMVPWATVKVLPNHMISSHDGSISSMFWMGLTPLRMLGRGISKFFNSTSTMQARGYTARPRNPVFADSCFFFIVFFFILTFVYFKYMRG